MGKVRVKTIGLEDVEQEKKKAKKKKEAKKMTKLSGMKGGERIAVVGPTEEELEKTSSKSEISSKPEAKDGPASASPKSFKKEKKRSAKYNKKIVEIDKNKLYPIGEALVLLRKIKLANFDETVELHINTTEPGITGTVKLPHGIGKDIKVVVADPSAGSEQVDALLNKIEAGKIDFDVLIATPDMMPKLARVAKVLGPRGLMPNPKNGTISNDPKSALKNFQGGQIRFKTENNLPVIHLSVGKTSYNDEKLSENIKTIITAVKKDRIRKATLSSTMSPGIKLAF